MKNVIILYFLLHVVNFLHAKENVSVFYIDNEQGLEQKAATELCKYLKDIYTQCEFNSVSQTKDAPTIVIGSYDRLIQKFDIKKITKPAKGGFVVTSVEDVKSIKKFIIGEDSRAVLDGVYALLEHLGYGFYLTHDTKPLKKSKLDFAEWDIHDNPLIEDRIVFNWHNFLSGCTSWNYIDWQSWIEQSSKMRYNTIMVHAYANSPMFQFEVNGVKKPVGYMNTSNTGRDWGGQHVNDVRLLPGGQIFDQSVFGADAAKVLDEQRVSAATNLMQEVFSCAKRQGMNVIFAFDCDMGQAHPQEIVLSLPENARFKVKGQWLVNPEVPDGYAYYKKMMADLLAMYPEINKVALWVRGNAGNPSSLASLWRHLSPEEMPGKWKKEYNEWLRNEGRVIHEVTTSGAFALSKMVKAYQEALKELGRSDVELMIGSWKWDFVAVANHIMPTDVSFIPLDYDYVMNQPATQYQLAAIGEKRKLIPVVWAHHDDHRYIGRPYRPYADFANILKMKNAAGFGIIHWTTEPYDLFFKNMNRQIWSSSKNESLKNTINKFVNDEWKIENWTLSEYLYKWSTEAPMFGRETGDAFFDYNEFNLIKDEFGSCENIINKSKERLSVLETVNRRDTKYNMPLFERLKHTENFYIDIFKNQDHYNRAYELLTENKVEAAQQEIQQTSAEYVIESYIKTMSNVSGTIGEKGIVYSMASRYYPQFLNIKQRAGMIPAKYKFAQTKHDKLAQGVGRNTWFIDNDKELWSVWGVKEIGEGVLEFNNCVSFSQPISLPIKTILGNPFSAGKYKVVITSPLEEKCPLDIQIVMEKNKESNVVYESSFSDGKSVLSFDIYLKGDDIPIVKLLPRGMEMKITQMIVEKK